MSEQPEAEINHTYAKLAILCEAATRLRDDWDKVEYAEREKLWWTVHKASREVWNILHPLRKVGSRPITDALLRQFRGRETL